MTAVTAPLRRAHARTRPAGLLAGVQTLVRRHPLGAAAWASATSAFGVVFLMWFSTGKFFATGDITPWVRDGLRSDLGWQWTHQLTGAGGPSYEIARLPEVLVIDLAHLLGGTEALGQRLLFAFMWAFAAGGGATLVAAFARRPTTVFLGGLVTAFNTSFMLYLPNYLPVVTVGIMCFATAIAVRSARGERHRWVLCALSTVPLSYVSLNPPLVVVVVGWFAALPFVAAAMTGTGRRGAGRTVGLLVRTALLAIPLALWWMVPMYTALTGAAKSGTVGAETDVVAWSWTHRHNSIANVMTLRSAWTWPLRQYHGASVEVLTRPMVSWLAWLFPSGAVLGPLVVPRERRRPLWWIAVAMPVLVFLAKGLHAPLSGVNLSLYRHVPGLWLLREPMSKLGPIFVLLYVLAWAMTIEHLAGALKARWPRVRKEAGSFAALALAVGPFLFVAPMLTGAATDDVQPGRTERVAIPSDWRSVARFVNESPVRGKAIVFPLGDFYQLPTTWGYYGADVMARQLLTRPVITRFSGGYFSDSPTFDTLAPAAETAIAGGDAAASISLLRALGVSHIIVRKDIDLHSPQRTSIDVRAYQPIEAGLATLPGLTSAVDNSMAHVFVLDDVHSQPVQAIGGILETRGITDKALVALLVGAPDSVALADTGGSLSLGQSWASTVGEEGATFLNRVAGTYLLDRRTRGTPLYRLTVVDSGENSSLVLTDAVRYQLGTAKVPSRPDVVIPLPSEPEALGVDGQLLDLRGSDAFVPLTSATSATPYVADSETTLTSFSPVGDCNRYDPRPIGAVGISSTDITAAGRPAMRLTASRHSACRYAEIPSAVAGDALRLQLSARSLAGAPPRWCLYALGPNTCVPLPSERRTQGWVDSDALVTLPPGTTGARLYVYADEAPGVVRSVVDYRPPVVSRLLPMAPVMLAATTPTSSEVALPAGTLGLRSSVDIASPKLMRWSDVQDCNRNSDMSFADAGLDAAIVPGFDRDRSSVRLLASSHAACVTAEVRGMRALVPYEVRFTYRTITGKAPRYCLFDRAAERCLPAAPLGDTPESLKPTPGWTTARYLVRPDADTVRRGSPPVLYLYADGDPLGTAIDYRSVSISPVAEDSVTVTPRADRVHPVPAIDWHEISPARYSVTVHDATGPFLLALSDSWSPQWRVRGLTPTGTAQQLRIDGYRNGWVIDDRGTLQLTIEFMPARVGRRAIVVSGSTGLATMLLAGGRALPLPARRRRRPRHRLRRLQRWLPNLPRVPKLANLPKVSALKISIPKVSALKISIPKVSIPTVCAPRVRMLRVAMSRIAVPRVRLPKLRVPRRRRAVDPDAVTAPEWNGEW